MAGVTLDALQEIYAASTDPWSFRTSAYERGKYAATLEALPRPRHEAILEIGCGNGELARLLAERCSRYVGVDGASVAVAEARRAVPNGEFVQRFLPAPLPDGRFDLIILSEILYFFDRRGLAALAAQLCERWPGAAILSVNYLGDTGNELSGSDALRIFAASLAPRFVIEPVSGTSRYRIDRFRPAA